MPKIDTMTDEKVIEILATRGMDWSLDAFICNLDGGPLQKGCICDHCTMSVAMNWNPLESLDACHQVEERLDSVQREWYGSILSEYADSFDPDNHNERDFRLGHADARTKAYVLAEILKN